MKKLYFLALCVVMVLTSCNPKNKEDASESHTNHHDSITHTDTTAEHHAAEAAEQVALYACPMHPEVQGKKDDKCSECGMKLTEPVAEKTAEK